jgi:hypothetical protein
MKSVVVENASAASMILIRGVRSPRMVDSARAGLSWTYRSTKSTASVEKTTMTAANGREAWNQEK